jgi:hypothetical protein
VHSGLPQELKRRADQFRGIQAAKERLQEWQRQEDKAPTVVPVRALFSILAAIERLCFTNPAISSSRRASSPHPTVAHRLALARVGADLRAVNSIPVDQPTTSFTSQVPSSNLDRPTTRGAPAPRAANVIERGDSLEPQAPPRASRPPAPNSLSTSKS